MRDKLGQKINPPPPIRPIKRRNITMTKGDK